MSASDVDRARMAITSDAAVMSNPVWRVTPSILPPRPTMMLRSARSFTSMTRRQVMLCRSRPSSLPWCRWLSTIADRRLCAAVTAWKSPVRWRLSSSIGITWLYPPPAAPPLMPKVGPMLGWRRLMTAFLPMCFIAIPRPTVVVVLPSPSGVGVIAVTTTYFALGRSLSSSIASRRILARSSPCCSSRCGPMPICAAMSPSGAGVAARAISRSDGKDTVTP